MFILVLSVVTCGYRVGCPIMEYCWIERLSRARVQTERRLENRKADCCAELRVRRLSTHKVGDETRGGGWDVLSGSLESDESSRNLAANRGSYTYAEE